MNYSKNKKNIRRDSRKIIARGKLPPIDNNKEDVKTILDIDSSYYALVEGRPIRPNTSIKLYRENIKNIALKRMLQGFSLDEILRIDREIETERNIFEMIYKHFEEYQNSFDKFLADDNNKTIAIMQKSDALAKELANQSEDHKQANYEMASLKSKLQYIDDTLMILLSFQNFLYKASPILWQNKHNIKLYVKYQEIFTADSDNFKKIDIEIIKKRLELFSIPLLYFESPRQLLTIFGLLEKQNLNYLLVTEELNSEKNKFMKTLDTLKKMLNQELDCMQEKIKETEELIFWHENRETEVKETFFKILEEKFNQLISSSIALQILNYVEFAYEQLIAPNDTKLSAIDMTLALEKEYDNLMMDISAYDLDMIKKIEKETYESGIKKINQAKEAAKLLKDVDKLSKRLKFSYETSRKNIYK